MDEKAEERTQSEAPAEAEAWIPGESLEALSVEETQQGRTRQAIVCGFLAVLLTAVMVILVVKSPEWGSKAVTPYAIAVAVLGVVFVSDETLMALVQRVPVPAWMGGKK